LKINPNISRVRTGINAIIEMVPKPSIKAFDPSITPAAPCANDKIKVAAIRPVATPPESNAIPTNKLGTK